VLADWRSETYVYYNVAIVVGGVAGMVFSEAYEERGKAMAAIYNWKMLGDDEEVFEIRKHTYAQNAICVQKAGDSCWRAVCLSIELVETI